MTRSLRVGTRASPLARAQSEEVVTRLRAVHPNLEVETIPVRTHGDDGYGQDLGSPLDGKRMFTKRIDEALLDGRIDFAVHSLKDLPTDLVDGVTIAAVPPRADPRDVLVSNDGRGSSDLARGARIGTSSMRRVAQLLARWPGSQVVELHGNVDTRLRRLEMKDFDAIVIALAGLARLGIRGQRYEPLPPDIMTPAPGQGALGVETRVEDVELRRILGAIDDRSARITTEVERTLSARLGGGCDVPFGALATLEGSTMTLRAVVASPDGHRVARVVASGPAEGSAIVESAMRDLLNRGVAGILKEAF